MLPSCLKISLWHSFIIPSHLLMAGSTNAMCDCLGRSHMVPWQCCHISALCAEQLCAPCDYYSESCKFCLSQYLSLWGIFWFCFWAVFLLTPTQPFFGVECDGRVPDVTDTPDLLFAVFGFGVDLELWKEGEGVSQPLTMCHPCCSSGRQNTAGWILSS